MSYWPATCLTRIGSNSCCNPLMKLMWQWPKELRYMLGVGNLLNFQNGTDSYF